MDNMPELGEGTTTLPNRTEVLKVIVQEIDNQDCLLSALGYISRDIYALTDSEREKCFYCMGSMGSVAPLALGISLVRPNVRVFALEGDGSLLMNLGTLATLNRYGSNRVRLVIIDNGCYESTGGQPSQPESFCLEDVCRAAGLPTQVATNLAQVKTFVNSSQRSDKPLVLIAKVVCAPPSPRVSEEPKVIAKRFSEWLSH
ncbi:thiamine pyrophosphate-dependent enzyme [Scytonema sp. PCC 10023]|uniref:thiamine pyrophosphate-dependent enzyme n=1 Tax=Scytonema sp. PCC 10023 TaxID=1680591 RepID=UPI0039C66395